MARPDRGIACVYLRTASATAAMHAIADIVNFASATPRFTNAATTWEDFYEFRRKAEDDVVSRHNP